MTETETGAPTLEGVVRDRHLALAAAGDWTGENAARLVELLNRLPPCAEADCDLTLDASRLHRLDSVGALLIDRTMRDFEQRGGAELIGLPPRYGTFFETVQAKARSAEADAPGAPARRGALVDATDAAASAASTILAVLAMLGAVGAAAVTALVRPRRFRLTSAVHHFDRVGWSAIPIIVLMTMLIGGIIAQQGIFYFRSLGAEGYVVNLVGVLITREIGVLIVTIMVAGRSASAYTAEIGAMKMREEIDALRVIGLDPVQALMLPRVIALLVAVPILTLIGIIAALFGGGLVSWLYGGISPMMFVAQLKEAVSFADFQVGMIKAPFMALVVGAVACAEGLRVRGNVDSLGRQTTKSVVESIFLVIVLDGLFAIFFASIGL